MLFRSHSFYDTANLLEHLNRPTRKLLQNTLVELATEKEKEKLQQSERMVVEQKQEQLAPFEYKFESKSEPGSFYVVRVIGDKVNVIVLANIELRIDNVST